MCCVCHCASCRHWDSLVPQKWDRRRRAQAHLFFLFQKILPKTLKCLPGRYRAWSSGTVFVDTLLAPSICWWISGVPLLFLFPLRFVEAQSLIMILQDCNICFNHIHSDLIWHFLKFSTYFLVNRTGVIQFQLKKLCIAFVCRTLNARDVCAFKTVSAGDTPSGPVSGRKLTDAGIIQPLPPQACICWARQSRVRHTLREKWGALLSVGKALAFTADLCSSLQLAPQVIENSCRDCFYAAVWMTRPWKGQSGLLGSHFGLGASLSHTPSFSPCCFSSLFLGWRVWMN